jgi:hypothetical protein
MIITLKITTDHAGEVGTVSVTGLAGQDKPQSADMDKASLKQILMDAYIGRCGGPVNTSQITPDTVYTVTFTSEVTSVKEL